MTASDVIALVHLVVYSVLTVVALIVAITKK